MGSGKVVHQVDQTKPAETFPLLRVYGTLCVTGYLHCVSGTRIPIVRTSQALQRYGWAVVKWFTRSMGSTKRIAHTGHTSLAMADADAGTGAAAGAPCRAPLVNAADGAAVTDAGARAGGGGGGGGVGRDRVALLIYDEDDGPAIAAATAEEEEEEDDEEPSAWADSKWLTRRPTSTNRAAHIGHTCSSEEGPVDSYDRFAAVFAVAVLVLLMLLELLLLLLPVFLMF